MFLDSRPYRALALPLRRALRRPVTPGASPRVQAEGDRIGWEVQPGIGNPMCYRDDLEKQGQ